MIDALLGKFYKYIIIGLLIFVFGLGFYVNLLSKKLAKAEQVKVKAVVDAVKPFQDAIDKATEVKITREKQWAEKLIEAEQNAIKQIQVANTDARSAHDAANSLSKQLGEASRRLSSASKETIINYTVTNSELLESCAAEYRNLAEKADGHAIDVRRLGDAWMTE